MTLCFSRGNLLRALFLFTFQSALKLHFLFESATFFQLQKLEIDIDLAVPKEGQVLQEKITLAKKWDTR